MISLTGHFDKMDITGATLGLNQFLEEDTRLTTEIDLNRQWDELFELYKERVMQNN